MNGTTTATPKFETDATRPSGNVGRIGAVVLALVVLGTACGQKDRETSPGDGGAAKVRERSVASSAAGLSGGRVIAEADGPAARPQRAADRGSGSWVSDANRERAGGNRVHDQRTLASPATTAKPSGPAVLEDCRERYVIAPGVEAEVRARVPEQFELRLNSNGQPLLYITAIHCERYTVGGVSRETTAAAFGVSIESPDGVICADRWPVLGAAAPEVVGSCNNYLFFAAYNNAAVVEWARAGTPDAPVYLVEDLSFDEGTFDPASFGLPLSFDSGSTPSGYVMDLVVRERPAELSLDAAFWFESEVGTVRVGFATDAIAMGEASGNLRVEPGSEMAVMLGTETPEAQFPFPLLAGNRWERATLTKTVAS